jgi:hypothetical protein
MKNRGGETQFRQVFSNLPSRGDQPTFARIAKCTGDSVATIWRIARNPGRADPMPCFARRRSGPGTFFAPYRNLYSWMERRKRWKIEQRARLSLEKVEVAAKALRPRSRSAEYWSEKRGRRLTVTEVRAIELERDERHGPGKMTAEFKRAVSEMNRTSESVGGRRRPRTPDQWSEVMCWIWAHDLKPMVALYNRIRLRAEKGALLIGEPL